MENTEKVENMLECDICGASFSIKPYLLKHRRTKHNVYVKKGCKPQKISGEKINTKEKALEKDVQLKNETCSTTGTFHRYDNVTESTANKDTQIQALTSQPEISAEITREIMASSLLLHRPQQTKNKNNEFKADERENISVTAVYNNKTSCSSRMVCKTPPKKNVTPKFSVNKYRSKLKFERQSHNSFGSRSVFDHSMNLPLELTNTHDRGMERQDRDTNSPPAVIVIVNPSDSAEYCEKPPVDMYSLSCAGDACDTTNKDAHLTNYNVSNENISDVKTCELSVKVCDPLGTYEDYSVTTSEIFDDSMTTTKDSEYYSNTDCSALSCSDNDPTCTMNDAVADLSSFATVRSRKKKVPALKKSKNDYKLRTQKTKPTKIENLKKQRDKLKKKAQAISISHLMNLNTVEENKATDDSLEDMIVETSTQIDQNPRNTVSLPTRTSQSSRNAVLSPPKTSHSPRNKIISPPKTSLSPRNTISSLSKIPSLPSSIISAPTITSQSPGSSISAYTRTSDSSIVNSPSSTFHSPNKTLTHVQIATNQGNDRARKKVDTEVVNDAGKDVIKDQNSTDVENVNITIPAKSLITRGSPISKFGMLKINLSSELLIDKKLACEPQVKLNRSDEESVYKVAKTVSKQSLSLQKADEIDGSEVTSYDKTGDLKSKEQVSEINDLYQPKDETQEKDFDEYCPGSRDKESVLQRSGALPVSDHIEASSTESIVPYDSKEQRTREQDDILTDDVKDRSYIQAKKTLSQVVQEHLNSKISNQIVRAFIPLAQKINGINLKKKVISPKKPYSVMKVIDFRQSEQKSENKSENINVKTQLVSTDHPIVHNVSSDDNTATVSNNQTMNLSPVMQSVIIPQNSDCISTKVTPVDIADKILLVQPMEKNLQIESKSVEELNHSSQEKNKEQKDQINAHKSKKGKHACPFCSMVYFQWSSLRDHVVSFHPSDGQIIQNRIPKNCDVEKNQHQTCTHDENSDSASCKDIGESSVQHMNCSDLLDHPYPLKHGITTLQSKAVLNSKDAQVEKTKSNVLQTVPHINMDNSNQTSVLPESRQETSCATMPLEKTDLYDKHLLEKTDMKENTMGPDKIDAHEIALDVNEVVIGEQDQVDILEEDCGMQNNGIFHQFHKGISDKFTKDFILGKIQDIQPALQFYACNQIMGSSVSLRNFKIGAKTLKFGNLKLKRIKEDIWTVQDCRSKSKDSQTNLDVTIKSKEAQTNMDATNKSEESQRNLDFINKSKEALTNMDVTNESNESQTNLDVTNKSNESQTNLDVTIKSKEAQTNLDVTNKSKEIQTNMDASDISCPNENDVMRKNEFDSVGDKDISQSSKEFQGQIIRLIGDETFCLNRNGLPVALTLKESSSVTKESSNEKKSKQSSKKREVVINEEPKTFNKRLKLSKEHNSVSTSIPLENQGEKITEFEKFLNSEMNNNKAKRSHRKTSKTDSQSNTVTSAISKAKKPVDKRAAASKSESVKMPREKTTSNSKIVQKILRKKALEEEKKKATELQPKDLVMDLLPFEEILAQKFNQGKNDSVVEPEVLKNLQEIRPNTTSNSAKLMNEKYAGDEFDDILTGMEDEPTDVNMICETQLFKDKSNKLVASAKEGISTGNSESASSKFNPADVLDGIYGPKMHFPKSFKKKQSEFKTKEFISPLIDTSSVPSSVKYHSLQEDRRIVVSQAPKHTPDFESLRRMLNQALVDTGSSNEFASHSSESVLQKMAEKKRNLNDDSITVASVFGRSAANSTSVPKFNFVWKADSLSSDTSLQNVDHEERQYTGIVTDTNVKSTDSSCSVSTSAFDLDSSVVKRVPQSVVKKSIPDSTTFDPTIPPKNFKVIAGKDNEKRVVTMSDEEQASGAVSSSGYSLASRSSVDSEEFISTNSGDMCVSDEKMCEDLRFASKVENFGGEPFSSQDICKPTRKSDLPAPEGKLPSMITLYKGIKQKMVNRIECDDSRLDGTSSPVCTGNEDDEHVRKLHSEDNRKESSVVSNNEFAEYDQNHSVRNEPIRTSNENDEVSEEHANDNSKFEGKDNIDEHNENFESDRKEVDDMGTDESRRESDKDEEDSEQHSSDDEEGDEDSENSSEEEEDKESASKDPVNKIEADIVVDTDELQLYAESDDSFLGDEEEYQSPVTMETEDADKKNDSNCDNLEEVDMDISESEDRQRLDNQPSNSATNSCISDQMAQDFHAPPYHQHVDPFEEPLSMGVIQQATKLQLIPRGYCFCFVKMGSCKTPNCSYTHNLPTQGEIFHSGVIRIAEFYKVFMSKWGADVLEEKESKLKQSFELFIFLKQTNLIIPRETLQQLYDMAYDIGDVVCISILQELLCLARMMNQETFSQIMALYADCPKGLEEALWQLFEHAIHTDLQISPLQYSMLFRIFQHQRLWQVMICALRIHVEPPVMIAFRAIQSSLDDPHSLLSMAANWISQCDLSFIQKLDVQLVRHLLIKLREYGHTAVCDSVERSLENVSPSLCSSADDEISQDALYLNDNLVVNSEDVKSYVNRIKGSFSTKNFEYLADIFIEISATKNCTEISYVDTFVNGFVSYRRLGQDVFCNAVRQFYLQVEKSYQKAKLEDVLVRKDWSILGGIGNALIRKCYEWEWMEQGFQLIKILRMNKIHFYRFNAENQIHVDAFVMRLCIKLDRLSDAFKLLEGNKWNCLKYGLEDKNAFREVIGIIQELMERMVMKKLVGEVTEILLTLLQSRTNNANHWKDIKIDFNKFFTSVIKCSIEASVPEIGFRAYEIHENCIRDKGLDLGLLRHLLTVCGKYQQWKNAKELFQALMNCNVYPMQTIESSPFHIAIVTSMSSIEVLLLIQDFLRWFYSHLCSTLRNRGSKCLAEEDLSLFVKIVHNETEQCYKPYGFNMSSNIMTMRNMLCRLLECEFQPPLSVICGRSSIRAEHSFQMKPQSLLRYLKEHDEMNCLQGLNVNFDTAGQSSSIGGHFNSRFRRY